MLYHHVEITSNMSTFYDTLGTSIVKRDLREKASDVEAKLFTLAELRVKEYVAKFTNCPLSQLGVTLVNICQVSQSSCHLN